MNLVDHASMKLGKLGYKHDDRTLKLENYLGAALPPAPPSLDLSTPIAAWPMMANDRLGDCTCAAAGHMIQQWSTEAGHAAIPTDADIIKAYSAISGYDPATGVNDNGAYELDLLNYWRKTGVGGHKITGFTSVSRVGGSLLRESIYLFGNCLLGLALPISAQSQLVWDYVSNTGDGAPGSWGGHAVPIVAYDASGATCITWGQRKKMTWMFIQAYCDEAWGALSPDWMVRASIKAPNGFDFHQLQTDLNKFSGRKG